MEYIGLDKQIRKNNFNSILLLIAFPALLLGMVYLFLFFTNREYDLGPNSLFVRYLPFVMAGVGIWFFIAWTGHSAFIKMAKSKIGSNNHAARRLINTETGEIFNTIKEVIPLVNLKRTTFQAMLNSQNPNKTKFKYYE